MLRKFKQMMRILGLLSSPSVLRHMLDSYSQEGEDMILRRLLSGRSKGFYVDVGAHHPFRFSNTYHFYARGWRGINIEPNPAAFGEFFRRRRRDINLCLGVAEESGALLYHSFNEPALNTFDEKLAAARLDCPKYRKKGESRVPVERLAVILERYLPAGIPIDFMNVDVEGFDLRVLRSNDWEKFRPTYVLVEALQTRLDEVRESSIYNFMLANDYSLISKTFNTLFFEDRRERRESSPTDPWLSNHHTKQPA